LINTILILLLFSVINDVQDDSGNYFVNESQRQMFWQKMNSFNNDQDKSGIVFIGNSLIEAFQLHEFFPGLDIKNRGITGDRIGIDKDGGILKRLNLSCYRLNPKKIFLMIGINDIGDRRRPVNELYSGYREIVKNIYDSLPSVSLFIHSILPTSGVYSRLNPTIDSFNELLISMVDSLENDYNILYIDLHSLFSDEEGKLRRELTIEGLHLKDATYQIWADAIWDLVYLGENLQIPVTFEDSL